ncbi:MAG: DinB family protein [Candidatus Heimdallarchaeota archaeon]
MNTNQQLSQSISEQYGAALTMLENIITSCQNELWEDATKETVVSQVVYHTLFFIDYYLGKDLEERENFEGKLGKDFMGERTDGMEWNKIYSKKELLDYLEDIRQKASKRFTQLTLEELQNPSLFHWHGSSVLSSLLYNLRHIMLHVGALHVRLNLVGREPMKWVSKASVVS